MHVVAARLGHADPAITLRVYAHVIRTAEAAAADIFAQAVNTPEAPQDTATAQQQTTLLADPLAKMPLP